MALIFHQKGLRESEVRMEEELHAADLLYNFHTGTKMKEFKIERCSKCGKTPSVVKHSEIKERGRYEIKCCSHRVLAATETQCIYDWNADQNMEDDLK